MTVNERKVDMILAPLLPTDAARRTWWWRAGCVALSAALMTIWHYGTVPLRGNAMLGTSDDAAYFLEAANGFSLDDVFKAYADHIAPVIRLIYFAFWTLSRNDWEPWGWFGLLGHATYCTLAGIAVLRFGGSLAAALAVTLPLVTALPLSSALRFHFAPFLGTWMVALILTSVLLVWRYLESGSRIALLGLFIDVLIAVFFATQCVIVIPVVLTFVAAHRVAVGGDGPRWRMRPREKKVLACLGIVILVYAAVIAIGHFFWNNQLPGTSPERPPSSSGLVIRFLHHVGYGLVEWAYPFMHGLDLDETPPFVAANLPWLVAILLGITAWLAVHLRGNRPLEARTCAAAGLGSIAVAAGFTVMVILGRPSTPMSSMRYNCVTVVFMAIAVGLAASLPLLRMSRAEGLWWRALLVLLACYSTRVNVWYAGVNRLNRIHDA